MFVPENISICLENHYISMFLKIFLARIDFILI